MDSSHVDDDDGWFRCEEKQGFHRKRFFVPVSFSLFNLSFSTVKLSIEPCFTSTITLYIVILAPLIESKSNQPRDD